MPDSMKKLLFLLLIPTLFITCDSNNEDDLIPDPEQESKLKLSKDNATLDNTTNYIVIDILESVGKCYASSSDEDIAKVEVDDKKLIILGFGEGETDIIISDSEANTAKVKISVDGLIIRKTPVTEIVYVRKGDTRIFSHPYDTESGYKLLPDQYNDIITTEIAGKGKLAVDGKNIGRTVLSVEKHYWREYSYDIRVVEEYPLIVPIGTFSLPQYSKGGGFGIGMGNGGYKIESSDPTVAIGYFSEYAWNITNANYNPIILNIDSFNPGTAILTISDNSGQSKGIKVEVKDK